jgi:hypothetical protein
LPTKTTLIFKHDADKTTTRQIARALEKMLSTLQAGVSSTQALLLPDSMSTTSYATFQRTSLHEVSEEEAGSMKPLLESSERTNPMLEHPEPEGIGLYERKCILVDREIDAMAMGRYQWCLWALCGLGYMVDLTWAQALGLVLSPMQQELGFRDDQTGMLSTAFSIGLTAGMSGQSM